MVVGDEDDAPTSVSTNQTDNCCLSHLFLRAASTNPNKIAVIHASGGTRVSGTLRHMISSASSSFHGDADRFLNEHVLSQSPPVYPGDRCFTFSDITASVDSLSARLHSILSGVDDPQLIRPTGNRAHIAQTLLDPMPKSSTSFTLRADLPTDSQNMYMPKILGIYMPPSVEYIITVLAVLRCGEAFLPLDPSWPKERILSILSSTNADLIITSGSWIGESGSDQLDKSHWLIAGSGSPVLCFSLEENLHDYIDPSTITFHCKNIKQRLFCYLMYTSGSTGKPKGICGTEQGLLNRFSWLQGLYPLHGDEMLIFKTSISFVDHLQEFLGAILAACTLVIPPFKELKNNVFLVVDLLQAYLVNRLTAVPSLMRTIIPALQNQNNMRVPDSLKLLVLSGEVLPLSLWDVLANLLSKTSILNLYGSTEVSGDCTYFDCKKLPIILGKETLTSVPIGLPISNCDVMLVGEDDAPNQGELYVRGLCACSGYFSDSAAVSFDQTWVPKSSVCTVATDECGSQLYFRTGDFARRLHSGDLVFLGRKDRTVKVNGQRICLEEVENMLRGNPDVVDAAVIPRKVQGELIRLEAFVSLKSKEQSGELYISSIRSWMVDKLPLAMIPNHFILTESLPKSSSGKIDYEALAGSSCTHAHIPDEICTTKSGDLLQVIKKAFCDALMIKEISDKDDFFIVGGNSISAAHVSHNLGIDMRLLYNFPSPFKLYLTLLQKKAPHNLEVATNDYWKMNLSAEKKDAFHSVDTNIPIFGPKQHRKSLRTPSGVYGDQVSKRWKADLEVEWNAWTSPAPVPISCALSRCNRIMHEGNYQANNKFQAIWTTEVLREKKGFLRELWKVHMESCVDASPVLVVKGSDIYLLIGSHAHTFICVNAKSGYVQWEIKLEGRIECSAAILSDFSQIVVGCYKGKIYFLDFSNGDICWTFQTSGEVKSQPIIDKCRHLIWCGTHDHNLYALDYINQCCLYKLPCGGSIYGSPAIDEERSTLYVASTSGRVTAVSLKALPFDTLWLRELEVPVFASLCISPNGYVICCLVDGHVVAFDVAGITIWKCRTGGPIFAGACISTSLPSQVFICSRNGSIYSFEQLSFHQLFEATGLGGCITQGEFKSKSRTIMVLFFLMTTPFGIMLGMRVTNWYNEKNLTLAVEGSLNAATAGILIYMALVDLLAADFMNSKMISMLLHIGANVSLLLGSGVMPLVAIWVYCLTQYCNKGSLGN